MPYYAIFILIGLIGLLASCTEPERPTVNLFRAVEIGDLDQTKRHLYWNADIEEANSQGDRPLHIAARLGRITIAQELVDHGAELAATNGQGRTALQLALLNGRTQLAEMLMANGATLDTQAMLVTLIREGVSDRDALDFLIERGVDLEARAADGLAPIHRAVALGHVEITARLIRAGVDINRLDGQGRTPLAIAIEQGHRDLIKLLEQYSARPSAAASNPPANAQQATTEVAQ